MARDWSDELLTTSDLERRIEAFAPGNTAPVPIATAKVRNEITSEWEWTVDIHIRIPRVTEYEVNGTDYTLPGALRRAYLALNAEARVRRQSDLANAQFGINV